MKSKKFYGSLEELNPEDEIKPVDFAPKFGNKWAEGYDVLTESICVGLGFCGSIHHRRFWHVNDLIPMTGILTSTKFAQFVLEAERMNSSLFSSDFRRFGPTLADKFELAFGRKTIRLGDLHRAVPGLGKHPSKCPPICFSRKLPNINSRAVN